jgi:hypothetical protein
LPIGQFTYRLQDPNLSRAEMIAFLWDLPDAASVRAVVVVLALVFGVGLALAPWGGLRLPLSAAGIALIFVAVSGTYAVLSPPLDAPDEQDHLISFYSAAGVADGRARVMELAARNHWERWVPLTSPFEKFSADDTRVRYQAVTRDWATSGLVARERSGIGGYNWRAIAPLVVRGSTPQTLLGLRWINAVTVSVAVFVATWLVLLRVVRGPERPWAPLVMVPLPSAAYLAMASSNYILIIGCGLVLAGALFPGRPDTATELASWFLAALAGGDRRPVFPQCPVVGRIVAGGQLALVARTGRTGPGCVRQGSAKWAGQRSGRVEVGWVLGGELEGGFELAAQRLHVEVDGAIRPFLVRFGGEGADQAQAALRAGLPKRGVVPALGLRPPRRNLRGVGDRKTLPQHGPLESTGELMPAEIAERKLRGQGETVYSNEG